MKIIALQTTDTGRNDVRRILNGKGFEEGRDYKIFSWLNELNDFTTLMEPGDRQILITGSLLGRQTRVINQLILTLKEVNPQLVAIRFSSIEWEGPFDDQLDYEVSDEEFWQILEKYLS